MQDMWEKFAKENKESLNAAAKEAKEALGAEAAEYADILSNNEALKSAFSSLSPKDMEKLTAVINNPELIKRILSSPKARENLKKILGK